MYVRMHAAAVGRGSAVWSRALGLYLCLGTMHSPPDEAALASRNLVEGGAERGPPAEVVLSGSHIVGTRSCSRVALPLPA